MKFFFKNIILYLIFIQFYAVKINSQPIYNKKIKKQEFLKINVDKNFSWNIKFPYDFQYKIYKEGNFWNFEGKNLGEEKLFVKLSAIENRKQITLLEFNKEFLNCKLPFDNNQKLINIHNPVFKNFSICTDNKFYEYKSYLFFNNNFYIIYIVFTKDILQEIEDFIHNIEFTLN